MATNLAYDVKHALRGLRRDWAFTLIASAIPARRASSINPTEALRAE